MRIIARPRPVSFLRWGRAESLMPKCRLRCVFGGGVYPGWRIGRKMSLMSWMRRLIFGSSPKISREQALETVVRVCREREWPLVQPRFLEKPDHWMVWIDRDSKSSPWILIDG